MRDLVLFCTQLRSEEKALLHEAKKQGLKMSHQLVRTRVDYQHIEGFAIMRTLGHLESIYLSNLLELQGVKVYNSSNAIRICADKSLSSSLMKSKGISQPKFEVIFSPQQLWEITKRFSFPLVIKPLSASWGRGVCLVRDTYCVENWLAARESLDALHKNFPVMIQEYIDKPGYDLRVIVVGTSPIVAFKRVSSHWITNTHLGATIEKIELNQALISITQAVAEAVGSGFYGIDLFETKEGNYLFNEINHNPDFSFSSSIHKTNVAEHYIGYIKREFEQSH